MSTNTSIGPDASRGGNDNPGNADGCGNKTLGSHATQLPPTAADGQEQGGPAVPPGGTADSARGKPPRDQDR